MAGISLEIARKHLSAWLEAELEVTTHQSYTIGSRSLTKADLADIRQQIEFWKNEVTRLENIEKMISPVGSSSSEEPDSRQSVLVKISVASRITGYSVNYLYHLASSGAIPYVKRGRSLRFDVNELQQWMQQQYIPASNKLSDERKKE
mgnify:CR=1 FL=1